MPHWEHMLTSTHMEINAKEDNTDIFQASLCFFQHMIQDQVASSSTTDCNTWAMLSLRYDDSGQTHLVSIGTQGLQNIIFASH